MNDSLAVGFLRLFFVLFVVSGTTIADANLESKLEQATVLVQCSTRGAFASGTVVTRRPDLSVIATCAHVFKDLRAPTTAKVTFFVNGRAQTLEGFVYAMDERMDVALIAVKDAPKSPVFPIAPRTRTLHRKDKVLVAGCDWGREPSVRPTNLVYVDRYMGRPNAEVDAPPKQGRSGGAMISKDGFLIGVCNSLNDTDNLGVYATQEAFYLLRENVNRKN